MFDGKNRVNDICTMLFGDIVDTNITLRDFLVARSALTFSERSVDFFFKRSSPYSTRDLIDKFKLRTLADAVGSVKLIFSADPAAAGNNSGATSIRKSITVSRACTSDTDVELRPHMPDSYNIYNPAVKCHILAYVKSITAAIVDFFRKQSQHTVIIVCVRGIHWLHVELTGRGDFSDIMFKHYNACILFEKKK